MTSAEVEKKDLRCPLCGKARSADYVPFCSLRCANIDLGRWLNESYAIPARESDEDDE